MSENTPRRSDGPQRPHRRPQGDAPTGNSARSRRRARKRAVASGDLGRGKVDLPRRVAHEVLIEVASRDAYANLLLPTALKRARLKDRDAAFATELTYGTLRAQGQLDAIINACSSRPTTEMDVEVLTALRLGAYQLLRTRVDTWAAVDTTVGLLKTDKTQGSTGFVNAILRKISTQDLPGWLAEIAPPITGDPIGHVALHHAHPRWIAESFALALGPRAGELQAALAADDARPVVHLAARPGVMTQEELALITGGEEGPYSPYAVHLPGGDPGDLDVIAERMATVQDEGSQLIARALVNAPLDGPDHGKWVDLCAGPGGKAVLLGALAAIDQASVDAVEPTPHRAELVRRSVQGLPVTVHEVDGRDSGLTPGADRVLVDAPCSGLGALRRRPEARWRKQPTDIAELTVLQRELLEAAVRLTRDGGVVVYSTCSPHPEETTAVVQWALAQLPVTLLDTPALVEPLTDAETTVGVQMWPHRHGTDAMYLAALRVQRH